MVPPLRDVVTGLHADGRGARRLRGDERDPTAGSVSGVGHSDGDPAIVDPAELLGGEVAGLDGPRIRTLRLEIDFDGPTDGRGEA